MLKFQKNCIVFFYLVILNTLSISCYKNNVEPEKTDNLKKNHTEIYNENISNKKLKGSTISLKSQNSKLSNNPIILEDKKKSTTTTSSEEKIKTNVIFSHGLGQENANIATEIETSLNHFIKEKFNFYAPITKNTFETPLRQQANELKNFILHEEGVNIKDRNILIGHSQGAPRIILTANMLKKLGYKNLEIITVGGVISGAKGLENIKDKINKFVKEGGPFDQLLIEINKQKDEFLKPLEGFIEINSNIKEVFDRETIINNLRKEFEYFDTKNPGINDLKPNSLPIQEVKAYLRESNDKIHMIGTTANFAQFAKKMISRLLPIEYSPLLPEFIKKIPENIINKVNESYNEIFFDGAKNDTLLSINTQLCTENFNPNIIKHKIYNGIIHHDQILNEKVLEEIAKIINNK